MIQQIIGVGAHPLLPSSEQKKIRLINTICLIWGAFTILWMTIDTIGMLIGELSLSGFQNNIITHTVIFLCLGLTVLLNKVRKYQIGHFIFFTNLFFSLSMFSFILEPGKGIEFFMIIIAPASLVFFNNKKVNYLFLIISFALFYAPNLLAEYGTSEIESNRMAEIQVITNDPTIKIALFYFVFVLVYYFKQLNDRNEELLTTQRNEAIRNAKIITAQKDELEKLHEFKSHFFVNISHEIRTPLTLISGYNESISDILEKTSNKKILYANQAIDNQCQKIKSIVDSVVDLSKLDLKALSLDLKIIQLNTFIRRIYKAFKLPYDNKQVGLALIDEAPDLFIQADALYLERAFNNILNNALKYTEAGQNVVILLKIEHDTAYIEVNDEGMGIPEDEVDKVFERFYQVKDNLVNQTGGSGIGLAFSKEIISLHEGNITVKSKLNEGSSFIISLPTLEEASYQENVNHNNNNEDTHHAIDNLNNSSHHILVVEDNREMRKFIVDLLKQYKVSEANNGVEALEILANRSIDLVITDYMMPKMDGYDLVIQIKKNHPKVPVIILTARTEPTTKLELLGLGVNDYIHKPFSSNELSIRVKNILSEDLKIDKSNSSDKNDNPLNKLKSYIEENANQTINVNDIADHLYMSKSTLSRLVKAETGLSTNHFIREIKLRLAKKYIEENRFQTIKELSNSIGYSKTDYFSKLYEDRFGTKPSDLL
ncbi:response regulator [Reichenbachiella versicolor]|uniref:response regulator n=1 Tax=Reichenbachiella versicolor TaxID=1821036 RepID=UPI000D6E4C29|nr:response regulator [Reichenbachiella versicolor]